MKCTLAAGIESMSGKNGNILFKTFTKPDGSKQTRAYLLPQKEGRIVRGEYRPAYGYKRTTKLSDNEIQARGRFSEASRILNAMSDEMKQQYAKDWKAAKYKLNGKKYNTLRGYIIARLYADKAV